MRSAAQRRYGYDLRGRLNALAADPGDFFAEHTGLGALTSVLGSGNEMAPLEPAATPAFEEYSVDPLGNTVYSTLPFNGSGGEIVSPNERTFTNWAYRPYGAVESMVTRDSISGSLNPPSSPEERTNRETLFFYDGAGNQARMTGWRGIELDPNNDLHWRKRFVEETSYYYDHDQRLRAVDQVKCVAHDGFPGQCRWEQEDFEYEPGAVFEEYRYDALGRRVMVRSRPVPECSSSCTEHLDVQVWDGDQLAFEHRAGWQLRSYRTGSGPHAPAPG